MTEVKFEIREGVALVNLHAPSRRNALTPAMADELVAIYEEIDRDAAVGAVVITGGKEAFCAGMDLNALAPVLKDPLEEENFRAIDRIYQAFLRVHTLKAPVLAAIRGAVVGAGVNLALAADLRIVADDAQFISGFVRHGLHPGGGHFSMLAEATRPEAAAAFAIFGETLSGTRAVELGLAWQALPDEQVDERAFELAARAAADPELSRRAIATLRLTTGERSVSTAVAAYAERVPQLWSQRRAGNLSKPK